MKPRTKAQTGRMARRKGNAFECTVANVFKGVWPNAKRGVGQTQSGDNSADVEGCPYWIECKVGKTVSIRRAIKQAETECDERPILVVSKRDREGTYVTMSIEAFVDLASRAQE